MPTGQEGHLPPKLIQVLLICGIMSSLLWMSMDIIAALLYPGYSILHQAISELSALGAPTRSLLTTTGLIYEILLLAFGFGVMTAAGPKRALRLTGILIIAHAVLGMVSAFFPMNLRESQKSFTDIMHLIIYTIIPILILVIIWFGSKADGKWFRIYSLTSICILILSFILTGLAAPGIAAGLPTPWVGVYERINVYGYMLWVLVFAIVLLQIEKGRNI